MKDLFVADGLKGSKKGLLSLYLNTGTKESPEFTLQGEVSDRFGTVIDHNYLRVNVVDMNNDGLLDIVTGENNAASELRFYENIGTKEEPLWDTAHVLTHIDGSGIKADYAIQFGTGDIDNDGVIDIILNARHHSNQASNWQYEAQLGFLRGYLPSTSIEKSTVNTKLHSEKPIVTVENNQCMIRNVESVKLYSVSGKLLQEKQIASTSSDIIFRNLPAGCYVIRSLNGGSQFQQKLFIGR